MAIRFPRAPYEVSYYKNGERFTYRRRPPERLHDIWPEDEVSLVVDKNLDFQEGDVVEVSHINPRHPNVFQLENDEGTTTFVEYFDVELENEIGPRDGPGANSSEAQRYLLWP